MTSDPSPHYRKPAARWLHSPAGASHQALAQTFTAELGLLPTIARILVQRGFETVESVNEFISPRLSRLHDPFLLRGMHPAVERLQRAIAQRELILIYGDYDVDGTTSVVVLKKTIELLGGIAEFHIPHRLREGYGMRSEALREAAARGVRVVVSVDTGIRALAAVACANECGIDVIVTDHHLPDCELPPALAVVNPNQPGCPYPSKDLCGAAVTFKLAHALLLSGGLEPKRRDALLDSFLKPVAIATVADIVPLTGENRVIVRRGLSGMRHVKNAGLRALLKVAGLDEGVPPSSHEVAFQLAPRINAAGRMASAGDVVDLFLTSDPERAEAIAAQLDLLNRERQQTEREIVAAILAGCEAETSQLDAAALVFWAADMHSERDWHLGVLGIVASRLVERFCRPVFVLGTSLPDADGELLLTGSGRSVPGFHLLDALESMSDLFLRHGGHKGAAGLTLPFHNAAHFRDRFAAYAAQRLTDEDRRPQFKIDAGVTLSDLNEDLALQLFQLGPFGFGNAAPVLLCEAVEVAADARELGSTGKHFQVPLRQNGRTITAKAWNFGDRPELFRRGTTLDVLIQLEDDPKSRARGYPGWTVSLKDAQLRGQSP